MCKPCKAALKKYQKGGFSDSTFTNNGPTVKYQEQGVRSNWAPEPYKFDAENDPIRSGEFTMDQFLNEIGNVSTPKGTQEGMDAREAEFAATLAREKARVKKVIANIPSVTKKMSTISADIRDPSSTSDANRQFNEIDVAHDSYPKIGDLRNYTDSITAKGTIDPNLDYLYPDSPDGTPWTYMDYDPARGDEDANYNYRPGRALNCIGSACGAYQEAEKGAGSGGTKTKLQASNVKFRRETLAGNTNFTEVPFEEAETGDIIQNVDYVSANYDGDDRQVYRPHHAGIVDSVQKDGSVTAYNANFGRLNHYISESNFGANEPEQYVYRFTGDVPQDQAALNRFKGGTTNAFNFLQDVQAKNKWKENNPSIKALPMQPIPRIESGVNKDLIPSLPPATTSRKRLFRR